MANCKWMVREETDGSLWAYTPCKNGLTYLSKVSKAKNIKAMYDGCICPICKNTVEIVLDKGGIKNG